MADQITCEILIAMNDDGSWVVCGADEDALELMANNHGGDAVRVVKLVVFMTPPVVPEIEVSIPDDAGETVHAEAEEAA